jgi:hypothetical protein
MERAKAKNIVLSRDCDGIPEDEEVAAPAPAPAPSQKPRKIWQVPPAVRPSKVVKVNDNYSKRREREEVKEREYEMEDDLNDSGELADIKMLHATLRPEEKNSSGCLLDLHEAVQVCIGHPSIICIFLRSMCVLDSYRGGRETSC